MAQYERHVFICTNTRPEGHPRGCCQGKKSEAIRDALKAATAKAGISSKVRINAAGCLDHCEHGPTIVVYPDAVWYGFVKVEDVPEIVESHLLQGKPVERLRLSDECINTRKCPHRPSAH